MSDLSVSDVIGCQMLVCQMLVCQMLLSVRCYCVSDVSVSDVIVCQILLCVRCYCLSDVIVCQMLSVLTEILIEGATWSKELQRTQNCSISLDTSESTKVETHKTEGEASRRIPGNSGNIDSISHSSSEDFKEPTVMLS